MVNKDQKWCGEYIVIFYDAQLRLYPFFDNSGKAVNGGLPQVVELLFFSGMGEGFGRMGGGGWGAVGDQGLTRQPCWSTKQYCSFADLHEKRLSYKW